MNVHICNRPVFCCMNCFVKLRKTRNRFLSCLLAGSVFEIIKTIIRNHFRVDGSADKGRRGEARGPNGMVLATDLERTIPTQALHGHVKTVGLKDETYAVAELVKLTQAW